MAKALEGVRVLDFTRNYAGPLCTRILAELGADVIKLEIPQGGDGLRNLSPQTEGLESYPFVILNRGKRSITLDLNSEKGRKICKQLVNKCNVLVENFTPGVMDRFGLGYEQLEKNNPGLIYVSISGFGHTGPYRSRVAYDTIIQAMGGMISVNGQPDSPPIKVGVGIADFLGGLFPVIAILAALQYRSKTNKGQFIDISMQDCIWAITAIQFLGHYVTTGQEPPKLGNSQIEVTPFSIYPAKDGYVVIAIVTVGQWERLLRIMGREDLKKVPEYGTQLTRIKHAKLMDSIVAEWTCERTVNEILGKLQAEDLPCAPIPTFGQVANDLQLASRNMNVYVDQTISGKVRVPGSLFKMSETPGNPSQPAPFLGQHNTEVYSELLGFDQETLGTLQDGGVI